MENIKTLIVDDERFARERLQQILNEKSGIDIVQNCKGGNEAIEAINSIRPDLVFLDIEMPGCNGFEVLEGINSEYKPMIVFVSAYQNYAINAFDLNAVDYITKPINEERVFKSLDRVKNQLKHQSLPNDSEDIHEARKSNDQQKLIERYVVKNGNKVTVIKIKDILCIEADGNYINLVTEKKKYLVRSTLTGFLKKLHPDKFFQIHKSSIINIDYVECFEELLYGDFLVHLNNGYSLKMSRNYADLLKTL